MPDLGDFPIVGRLMDVTPPGIFLPTGAPVVTYFLVSNPEDYRKNIALARGEISRLDRYIHAPENGAGDDRGEEGVFPSPKNGHG